MISFDSSYLENVWIHFCIFGCIVEDRVTAVVVMIAVFVLKITLIACFLFLRCPTLIDVSSIPVEQANKSGYLHIIFF
jgi:hypothetical protein